MERKRGTQIKTMQITIFNSTSTLILISNFVDFKGGKQFKYA